MRMYTEREDTELRIAAVLGGRSAPRPGRNLGSVHSGRRQVRRLASRARGEARGYRSGYFRGLFDEEDVVWTWEQKRAMRFRDREMAELAMVAHCPDAVLVRLRKASRTRTT